jgi:hypothetical protein
MAQILMKREIVFQKRWHWQDLANVEWHFQGCQAPSFLPHPNRVHDVTIHLETQAARRLARKRLRKIECEECRKTLFFKLTSAYLMQPHYKFKEQLNESNNNIELSRPRTASE